MKKIVISFLCAVLVFSSVISPKTISAQTAAQQAFTESLLAIIAQLQQQLAILLAQQNSNCTTLTRDLYIGLNDAGTLGEVSKLQKFLKAQGDYTYPTISGFFGAATQQAVQRFQSRVGIISGGSPASTGWGVVGPATRAKIKAVGCSVPAVPVVPVIPTAPVVPENPLVPPPAQPLTIPKKCADNIDNDGDGKIDMSDPGCSSPTDDNEADVIKKCANGLDDDADGKIDFPADPGCNSANDNNENDVAAPPVSYNSVYGPGIGGDSLGNTALGGPTSPRKVYIRFRAEQSGPLNMITFPYMGSNYVGYGSGTGGEWKLELFEDDGTGNHFPSGSALATVSVPASSASDNDKQISFPSPYSVSKGTLYHLVFENIDADPDTNFFSVNNWIRLSPEGGQHNPKFENDDWGHGYFFSGSWQEREGYTSILDITYGNGKHQGTSYGEASYHCPDGQSGCVNQQLVGEINGSKMVRQKFTVSGGSKTVSGVGIRLLKVSGTASDLVLSLRNSADEEIDSVVIPASSVESGPAPSYSLPASFDDVGRKARWVFGTFNQPHLLSSGQTYYIRASSVGGTYWAWVMRKLSAEYAYSSVTSFSDGWAEYTTGDSSWSSLGRVNYQNDLQFYLKASEDQLSRVGPGENSIRFAFLSSFTNQFASVFYAILRFFGW